MKKSSERGRGRGRGVSPDGSGTRGRSGAPKKPHSIPPMLSRKSTLSNPKEQDQIINWMTSQASSSGLSSSSTSRTRSESSASCKEPVGRKLKQAAATPTPSTQLTNVEPEQFVQDSSGYSQELFAPKKSSTCQRAMQQPEVLCPDSQPFTVAIAQHSEMQGESEDDDTQIPEQVAQEEFESLEVYTEDLVDVGVRCAEVVLGSSTPLRTPTYEEFEEMEEEEVLDNVDRDPDYVCEPRRRDSSSTDESAGGEPTAARVRLVSQTTRRGSSDTTSVEGTGKRKTGTKKNASTTQQSRCSKVWPFFEDCSDNVTMVMCTVCRTRLSRGQNIRNLTTTSMRRHMEKKHPALWATATGQGTSNTASLGVTRLTTRPSSAAAAVAQPANSQTSDDADTVTFRNSGLEVSQSSTNATSNSPSVCSPTVQLSVSQMFERKRKMPANDAKAVALTASIAKFLACEMLPYRVVETNSFKAMMSVAIPRYAVPSRYHFARCAVPELHDYVVNKITRSLKNAVACKVHLTTDTWTSAFGQGRYISLTAHWVNLVEPGSDSSPATARVLPTPHTAAPPSLPLDNSSSSYLSDSFSSNTSQSQSCTTSSGNANPAAAGSWKQCSTAVGMRQQALLKLICLGDKQHTGEEIWRGIKQQTDLWLAPLDLKPGMVVCDNGSNLIRALRLAKLTHIPCLAHVMNLVVQRFLRTYPGVADLLSKVRRVAKHCRKSSTASEGLAKMQERFNLPRHRLLCDLPTRWNSTLHMLARFCEQKSAVVQYMTAQYRGPSGQLPSFCGSDWATMLELCQVLQNFEETTLLVSSDNSSVSITIPLLCLLKRSMLKIKESAVMMQVGESQGEDDQRDDTNIRPSASGNAGPSSSYDAEEEEDQLELEQEFDAPTAEGQSGAQWTSTIQREWSADAEEEESDDQYAASLSQLSQRSQEDVEDSGRTLAHMAQLMLDCIERDPRIVRILNDANYWVYTLLDPRYKHNVPKLLEESVRQVKMEEYQQALVETLDRRLTSSPSSSQLYADRLSYANPGGPGGQQRRQAAASAQKGRVSAVSLEWENFLTPMQQPTVQQSTSSNTERLEKMVKDYMSDEVAVLNNPSAPFNYWVSKLDSWHELAMYALEVLACPAASVMSERCFSAAGGIVTDRRIRLSTENADRLTHIKMNQSWIGDDYATLPNQGT